MINGFVKSSSVFPKFALASVLDECYPFVLALNGYSCGLGRGLSV